MKAFSRRSVCIHLPKVTDTPIPASPPSRFPKNNVHCHTHAYAIIEAALRRR